MQIQENQDVSDMILNPSSSIQDYAYRNNHKKNRRQSVKVVVLVLVV